MLKRFLVSLAGVTLALSICAGLFPSQALIVTSYLLRTNNGSDILNTTTFRSNLGAAKNGAVTGSGITMATARLLGRTTASTGAIEEIAVGSGLTLSGGSLTASGGSGTVTSVALALPSSILTVSGSPVTGSGTLTGTLATQSANLVWAGPGTGAAATPTFRSLVIADLPTSIPNANLANSAVTIAGLSVSLGGSTSLAASDLSNGVTNSGAIPLETTGTVSAGMSATSGTITLNSTFNKLRWARHGTFITLSGYLLVASVSSPSGVLTITGIPGSQNVSTNYSTCQLSFMGGAGVVDFTLWNRIAPNSTVIEVYKMLANALTNLAGDIQAGSEFYVSCTYFPA
jgi:hypothetical protein